MFAVFDVSFRRYKL